MCWFLHQLYTNILKDEILCVGTYFVGAKMKSFKLILIPSNIPDKPLFLEGLDFKAVK